MSRVDVISKLPAGDFNLKEVYLYNWKTRGRIAPRTDHGYYDPVGYEALKVSVPESREGLTGDLPVRYEIENNENKIEKQVYLHEAGAPEGTNELDATCLVVGGHYSSQPDITYYRIDFQQKIDDQYTYIDVLRNHQYVMNIIGVEERGYETPDSAFYYKKANITVEITTWNVGDLSDTNIGGNYDFSFSQSRFDLSPAIPEAVLKVVTDYPGEWTIENQDPGLFSIEKRKDSVYISVNSSALSQSFTGAFRVKAGKFTKIISVYYTV